MASAGECTFYKCTQRPKPGHFSKPLLVLCPPCLLCRPSSRQRWKPSLSLCWRAAPLLRGMLPSSSSPRWHGPCMPTPQTQPTGTWRHWWPHRLPPAVGACGGTTSGLGGGACRQQLWWKPGLLSRWAAAAVGHRMLPLRCAAALHGAAWLQHRARFECCQWGSGQAGWREGPHQALHSPV